jgi:hypothetical protein
MREMREIPYRFSADFTGVDDPITLSAETPSSCTTLDRQPGVNLPPGGTSREPVPSHSPSPKRTFPGPAEIRSTTRDSRCHTCSLRSLARYSNVNGFPCRSSSTDNAAADFPAPPVDGQRTLFMTTKLWITVSLGLLISACGDGSRPMSPTAPTRSASQPTYTVSLVPLRIPPSAGQAVPRSGMSLD